MVWDNVHCPLEEKGTDLPFEGTALETVGRDGHWLRQHVRLGGPRELECVAALNRLKDPPVKRDLSPGPQKLLKAASNGSVGERSPGDRKVTSATPRDTDSQKPRPDWARCWPWVGVREFAAPGFPRNPPRAGLCGRWWGITNKARLCFFAAGVEACGLLRLILSVALRRLASASIDS